MYALLLLSCSQTFGVVSGGTKIGYARERESSMIGVPGSEGGIHGGIHFAGILPFWREGLLAAV